VYAQIDRDHFRRRLLKYTRRAFKLLPRLEKPRIVDIGCGSGVPTVELARLSDGEIIGIDTDESLLKELSRKIEEEGLSDRVKTEKCSMFEMDFADRSFDVIWAEGSISVIGFERGLREWRRLLRTNGFLVVHDDNRNMSYKLERISSCGYRLVKYFSLPKKAWWKEYYEPLEIRLKELRMRFKNNADALEILKKHQKEVDLVKNNPEEYGSAFFVMQKPSKRGSQPELMQLKRPII
jgi:ubiquinone/menaquinone biosynthesis C-methylase UbiE